MLLLLTACALISDADVASRFDLDGDGVARPEDCDDDVANDAIPTWYPDADGDGWGLNTGTLAQCVQPAGYAPLGGDCNDADNDVNPGLAWFTDLDGDGFGNPDTEQLACEQPTGTVSNNADCDDTRIDVSPTAAELCDDANVDEDCDGLADDDDPTATGQTAWYGDADGDGLGTVFDAVSTCDQPLGYTDDRRDCDDADAEVTTDCRWVAVSAGDYQTCALRGNGTVACWGSDDFGQVSTTPTDQAFIAVSSGGYYSCGVRADRTLKCWGRNADGESTPPEGTFTMVSANHEYACALTAAGTITCWGKVPSGDAPPPGSEFVSVSAGQYGACALNEAGDVFGWYGIASFEGPFVVADAGFTACNTLDDHGNIVTTNEGGDVGGNAPAGTFSSFSTGHTGGCALTAEGSPVCWGGNAYGERTPPAGTFSAVSTEYAHTCAVTLDGFLECWGYDGEGRSTPPE